MCVFVCRYVCMYACMYVCIYVCVKMCLKSTSYTLPPNHHPGPLSTLTSTPHQSHTFTTPTTTSLLHAYLHSTPHRLSINPSPAPICTTILHSYPPTSSSNITIPTLSTVIHYLHAPPFSLQLLLTIHLFHPKILTPFSTLIHLPAIFSFLPITSSTTPSPPTLSSPTTSTNTPNPDPIQVGPT